MSHARPVKTALLALVTMALSVAPTQASDDPGFEAQWGLAQVRAERAWSYSTGAGIQIGIVDTGVDLGHEDLAGKVVAHTSCIGSAGNPAACRGSGQDDNGHGTHLAGVAAAVRDNRRGIAGVAPDAQLVVAKVVTSQMVASALDVVAGIKWVVDHGAQVVNLSLSEPDMIFLGATGSSLRAGLDYAADRGAVVADGRVACDEGSPSCYGLMDLGAAMDGQREPSAP